MLNKLRCHAHFKSDYLIQIVDINSHTEWQTVQILISLFLGSQLILIYTVYKSKFIRVQQDRIKIVLPELLNAEEAIYSELSSTRTSAA